MAFIVTNAELQGPAIYIKYTIQYSQRTRYITRVMSVFVFRGGGKFETRFLIEVDELLGCCGLVCDACTS